MVSLGANWVELGTLLTVTVGAVAAIWTARETRRLARLQERAENPRHPTISASFSPVGSRPDVMNLKVTIRNRADIDLELLRLFSPRMMGLRFRPYITTLDGRSFGDPSIRMEPEIWPRSIDLPCTLAMAGGKDTVHLETFAHRKLFPMMGGRPPVIRLEMRWRNHTVTTFITAVTVTKTNTK